jgi:hypothetical protein
VDAPVRADLGMGTVLAELARIVGRLEPKWGCAVGLVASGVGPRPEVRVVTRGAASRVLAAGKGPAEPEPPATDQ